MFDAETPPTFLIHPEYRAFVRGESQHLPPPTSPLSLFILTLIYASIPSLIFLIVGQLLWRDYNNARQLEEEGMVTAGTIRGRDMETDSEGSPTYYVKYDFWVNEMPFSATDSVSEEFYEDAEIGAPTQVRYVPYRPENSEIAGEETNWRTFAGVGIALGVSLFTGILFGWLKAYRAIGNTLFMRRISQTGQWIGGRVCESHLHEDSEGDITLKIVGQFISPRTDKPITQKFDIARNDLSTAPAVSTTVAVLYENDRHYVFL